MSCKNEGVSSSCSTNKASTSSVSTATDKAKGAGCMDKFVSQVQPVTVMKGDKFARANELLVKALTGNLLPSALLDSPEFRDFLAFISGGTYVPPHRTKVTELIDLQYAKVLIKIKMLMANAPSVSVTTDAASMHTGDSYVGCNSTLAGPQWIMMSCVLGVSISNAEEIASVVKEMANTQFMLENRLDAIASDQGATFVAAVRLLIEEGVGEEQDEDESHNDDDEDDIDTIHDL
eukprot:Em0020g857a